MKDFPKQIGESQYIASMVSRGFGTRVRVAQEKFILIYKYMLYIKTLLTSI